MIFQENGKCNETYGKTVKGFNLINGEELDSNSAKRFSSTNPADLDDIVGTFPLSTEQDVRKAVDAANKAFNNWKNTPAPVRANVIGRCGAILETHKHDLALLMTREMGKTPKESLGSVQEAIDTCQFFQSEGRRLYGQTVPSEMRNKELFTYRRPYGVVGVITPSNFPIAVASWKIIPALITGNTVVWKTPPEAPTVAYLFARIWEQAGLPKGVLNVVHGDATAGVALVNLTNENKVHKISFTGSTKVGRLIGETCGKNLQTPSLELGGKNPLVVMDDANLELAVSGALWASFGTAGQRCTSAGNIILHTSIADSFKNLFYSKAKEIKIGNALKDPNVLYGPMIAEHYFTHFMKHFDEAKKDPCTLVMGAGRITSKNKPTNFVGNPDSGFYVFPTIWDNVKINHWVAQEEVFGPVVTIIEVKDFDEALNVANGTKYGLSAAIYTQNRMNAYRFKNEIQSGMCSINNSTTGAEAHLPFGGMKASGNGTRESGIWVIDAFTQWQAVNDELSGKLQLAQMDTEGLETSEGIPLSIKELIPTFSFSKTK